MKTNFETWVSERWESGVAKFKPSDVPFPMVAALGLTGECGEVIEHLKKHFRDGKHPGDDLRFELGDVLHYLVVIAQSYGWTLEDLMGSNRCKLERRDADKRALAESIRNEMEGA